MMKMIEDSGGDIYAIEKEAVAIHEEDADMCRQIGKNGAKLIEDECRILTHCNAGALATGGIGTALGIVYTAKFSGKNISVWVDETRPILQGARLTTWELDRAGVPLTLICDNMAASLIAAGCVDCVIVGADRIAANYDVANKIGTYNLAVLCRYHKIENRPQKEIKTIRGIKIAPKNVNVFNPAFDITPHDFITAIITENDIIRP